MTPSKTIHTRVPLTAEELAELDRRKSNAAANRAIMALKQDLKGVTYCIKHLKAVREANPILVIVNTDLANYPDLDFAIKLLSTERARIRDLIKELDASKRKQGEENEP